MDSPRIPLWVTTKQQPHNQLYWFQLTCLSDNTNSTEQDGIIYRIKNVYFWDNEGNGIRMTSDYRSIGEYSQLPSQMIWIHTFWIYEPLVWVASKFQEKHKNTCFSLLFFSLLSTWRYLHKIGTISVKSTVRTTVMIRTTTVRWSNGFPIHASRSRKPCKSSMNWGTILFTGKVWKCIQEPGGLKNAPNVVNNKK